MIKDKKVLITGSSGFIGTNLLNAIKGETLEIAVLDRSDNVQLDNVTKFVGDICDNSFVERAILKFQPNIVFHLAGYKNRSSNIEEVSESLKVNLIGTLNLYQALTKVTSVESIVTLGTTDEYGMNNSDFSESSVEKPISPYGFSKFCGTQLAQFFNRTFDLPVIVLRPTIAYGPYQANDMFIPSLITTLMSNRDFEMTEGYQLRDFIYISDLVDAMLLISENQNHYGEVFNIGSGQSLMLREIASTIAKDLNMEQFLKIGTIPYRQNEVMRYKTSIDKIYRAFGWKSKVCFEKGIELTIRYYRDNG